MNHTNSLSIVLPVSGLVPFAVLCWRQSKASLKSYGSHLFADGSRSDNVSRSFVRPKLPHNSTKEKFCALPHKKPKKKHVCFPQKSVHFPTVDITPPAFLFMFPIMLCFVGSLVWSLLLSPFCMQTNLLSYKRLPRLVRLRR